VLPRVAIEVVEASPDQRDYRVSFDKIRHVLNFRPRFTVEDGVREMARAFTGSELKDPEDARYFNVRSLAGRRALASSRAGAA
jgi:hypothetical protein